MNITMTSTEAVYKPLKPIEIPLRFPDLFVHSKNKTRTEWTIEKLQLTAHQYILEVGFKGGETLQKAAKKLQTGFLAGVDESVRNYQLAFKRNRKFIEDQLVELHLGKITDLPYPHHYFHTIFGNNIYNSWEKPQDQLIQLARLLRIRGKLVMVFQPENKSTETEIWDAAEQIQLEFAEAGLSDISVAYREMYPVSCIAATGYRY